MKALRVLALGSLAGSALALAAIWAYYTLFSSFLPYDDEGLFLHASQLLLAGEALYTEIPWPYGPTFPALAQLLHGVLDIPISTDWARWRSLVSWLSLSLLAGALLLQQGRGGPWPIAAALLVMLYLQAFAKEPGHPQGLIACLTVLLPLIIHRAGGNAVVWRWLAAGAVAGLILHMKLNAGLFCLGAAAMVLASHWQIPRLPRVWPAIMLLCAALFPLVLMAPLLLQDHVLGTALVAAIMLVTVQLSLLRANSGKPPEWGKLVAFLAGLAAISLLLFANTWRLGATPLDIFSSLLVYTASQAEFYHFFLPYSVTQLVLAGASLLLAALLATNWLASMHSRLLCIARCLFCALTAFALLTDSPVTANGLLGWAGPWCWVALWRPGNTPDGARQLLVALAAWFPLLAYPIPGSQIYFGSFIIIPLAVLCLAELLAQLRATRLAWAASFGLALCLVALQGWQAVKARDHYHSLTPLALPGAERLRLPLGQVQRYQALVTELNKADVALASSGFNSLYLWSTAKPPAPMLFNLSLRFLSPAQQQRLQQGLEGAEQPLVLLRPSKSDNLEPTQLEQWVQANYQQTRRIRPFKLMRPDTDRSQ